MKTIGIIGGTGAMGKAFSVFFKKNGFKVIASSRKTKLSNKELIEKSDIVIYSLPIYSAEKIIKETAPFAKKGTILADFTSLKEKTVNAMKNYSGKGVEVLGIHPMFGPSVKNFENKLIVLCKGRGIKGLNFFEKLFKKNKVKVKIVSPEKHDKISAIIQAMIHINNLSLAKTFAASGFTVKELQSYSTPMFNFSLNSIGRMTAQNPEIYRDIAFKNLEVKKILKKYSESFNELNKIVLSKNEKKFDEMFKDLNNYFKPISKKKLALTDKIISEFF